MVATKVARNADDLLAARRIEVMEVRGLPAIPRALKRS